MKPVTTNEYPDRVITLVSGLYVEATGDGSACRVSDIVSDREFRSLGLYRDFYRPAEVDYQLAFLVPYAAGAEIAVALNRKGRELTLRQKRILELVADGYADREVGRNLGISTRTVHAHLQRIYRALDVTSRTEALARLRERSLTASARRGRRS
jgi:DNA-binding CsgD family transcriptional regulator